MRTLMTFTAVIAAGVAISGCGRDGRINPTAGGGGLQGSWLPDGGGYTATFDNGRFLTTASDTGNIISQGGYFAVSESEVQLTWMSNITGLENTASCQRPQVDTLNCTDGGGKSFTLRRT